MYNKVNHAELVIHSAKTDNTMSDARDILSSLKAPLERLLIISDEQSNGKGRNDNLWLSPKGGLWFTYCLKSEQTAPQLTLVLGLCLHKVLVYQFPDLHDRLQIKWPNDLILDNKKLSGILVQTCNGYMCIGIGINTNNKISILDVPFSPVSLKQILGFDVCNLAILYNFLEFFHQVYSEYLSGGLKPFRRDINYLLFGLNKTLDFDNNETYFSGTCRGISEDGALLLENQHGKINPYYSGSIIKVND